MKKSQAYSVDFVISLAIILLIITIIFWNFNLINTRQQNQELTQEMINIGQDVMENLISSQGTPFNWNSTNVQSIGLRDSNKLSENKINNMSAIAYSDLKQKLGVLGPHYEVGIKIYQYNGTDFTIFKNIGHFSEETEHQIIIQRHTLIQNWTRVNLYIWSSKINESYTTS